MQVRSLLAVGVAFSTTLTSLHVVQVMQAFVVPSSDWNMPSPQVPHEESFVFVRAVSSWPALHDVGPLCAVQASVWLAAYAVAW